MSLNPGGIPGHAFPYAQTITLVRRVLAPGKDSFGNDAYTDVPVQISNCVVQPAGSNETIDFNDVVSTDITVFVPYDADVSPLDALIINGTKYEVQGVPQQWRSPFSGRTSPTQVRATEVTGAST